MAGRRIVKNKKLRGELFAQSKRADVKAEKQPRVHQTGAQCPSQQALFSAPFAKAIQTERATKFELATAQFYIDNGFKVFIKRIGFRLSDGYYYPSIVAIGEGGVCVVDCCGNKMYSDKQDARCASIALCYPFSVELRTTERTQTYHPDAKWLTERGAEPPKPALQAINTGTSRELGRLPSLHMNSTEWDYNTLLGWRQIAGECKWWIFEGLTFKLAANTNYTPDFVVVENGEVVFKEVKGHMEEDAAVKIKVFRDMFGVKCDIVRRDPKRKGAFVETYS